jgi:hypothetical protein
MKLKGRKVAGIERTIRNRIGCSRSLGWGELKDEEDEDERGRI